MDFPMPGEVFDGSGSIVIASSYYSEEDKEFDVVTQYAVLLLNPEAPYYTFALCSPDRISSYCESHQNIVPAAECYAEWTGF